MDEGLLPPANKVTVRGGKVIKLERWGMWDGEPSRLLAIERREEGNYLCTQDNPETGKSKDFSGDLEAVVKRFHRGFGDWYRNLFGADVVTVAYIIEVSSPREVQIVSE
jgi:hypothetical protein